MESVSYDIETRVSRFQVQEALRKEYNAPAEDVRAMHDGIKSFARAQMSIPLTKLLRNNDGTTYLTRWIEEVRAPIGAEADTIDGTFVITVTMQALIDAIGVDI